MKRDNRFHRGAIDYARRTSGRCSSGHTFLIVTEGEKTEPNYFKCLKARLKLSSVDVEVAHPDGTDPLTLTEYAVRRRAEKARLANQGVGVEYDEVWVVFDLEGIHDPRREQARRAMSTREAHGIKFAKSDPSFEYWLILHFESTHAPLADSTQAEGRLRQDQNWPDYRKACIPPVNIIEKIPIAVENAKQCRTFHKTAGGDGNPFTEIDLLVRELNEATREHLRFVLPPQ